MNDICKNRHGGNAESVLANPSFENRLADRNKVLRIIKDHDGITSKEIAELMGRRLHCISGRISELKRDNLVSADGQRRKGCAVIVPKINERT